MANFNPATAFIKGMILIQTIKCYEFQQLSTRGKLNLLKVLQLQLIKLKIKNMATPMLPSRKYLS